MRQLVLPGEIGKLAPGRCLDCQTEISVGAKRCRKCNLESEEYRRKLLEAVNHPDNLRRLSEAIKKAHARGAYDSCNWVFRGQPTSIELQIAHALEEMGIEHESQYRPTGCSYVFDEFIAPNILVEIQGDYWHNLPKGRKRDAKKKAWAINSGYDFVVIWEHDIKECAAMSLVKERILPLLQCAA
jgi:G:T-mismatch repair DNA endonuclease (very short patch repair protein)